MRSAPVEVSPIMQQVTIHKRTAASCHRTWHSGQIRTAESKIQAGCGENAHYVSNAPQISPRLGDQLDPTCEAESQVQTFEHLCSNF